MTRVYRMHPAHAICSLLLLGFECGIGLLDRGKTRSRVLCLPLGHPVDFSRDLGCSAGVPIATKIAAKALATRPGNFLGLGRLPF